MPSCGQCRRMDLGRMVLIWTKSKGADQSCLSVIIMLCEHEVDWFWNVAGALTRTQRSRTTMVCICTVKGVYYWVKDINANFGQGTDGPMIGRAAAVRLERTLKPHLAILQAHRDDCLQNPSTFFTYALMSVRPALKDHIRWVDLKLKEWDEQVLDEMEKSKLDFQRAGSTSTPAWQSPDGYMCRPIALYCDGHHIGAIDPAVYASKLSQRH